MLEHLNVINPQECADQYGEAHCATLPPHLQGKVGRTQAVLITPAALAKRLSDAWQAGFARAAEAAKTDVDALERAAKDLYFAGCWVIDGINSDEKEVRGDQLWEALRDALGLPVGSATAAGVGKERS